MSRYKNLPDCVLKYCLVVKVLGDIGVVLEYPPINFLSPVFWGGRGFGFWRHT